MKTHFERWASLLMAGKVRWMARMSVIDADGNEWTLVPANKGGLTAIAFAFDQRDGYAPGQHQSGADWTTFMPSAADPATLGCLEFQAVQACGDHRASLQRGRNATTGVEGWALATPVLVLGPVCATKYEAAIGAIEQRQ